MTDQWFTKEQAADAIGVSTKTIETWAKSGRLKQSARRNGVSPDLAVYDRDQVQAERQARKPGAPPYVVPEVEPAADAAIALRPVTGGAGGLDVVRAMLEEHARALEAAARRVPLTDLMFLTPHQAAAVSGLRYAEIRRRMASGELPAKKLAGGWLIARKDLNQVTL